MVERHTGSAWVSSVSPVFQVPDLPRPSATAEEEHAGSRLASTGDESVIATPGSRTILCAVDCGWTRPGAGRGPRPGPQGFCKRL